MGKSSEHSGSKDRNISILVERRSHEGAVEAAKLIKFVTAIDPYSLTPKRFDPWKQGEQNYHTEITSAWEEAGIRLRRDLKSKVILWQGISDTSDIVHNALDDYGQPIAEDDAITVVRNDISVATIAHAAQLGEKVLRYTNYKQSRFNREVSNGDTSQWWYDHTENDPAFLRRFIIDDASGALIQNPEFDDSWENGYLWSGCPFAHGDTNRPKIFDRFARWAGTLAVREYFANKK